MEHKPKTGQASVEVTMEMCAAGAQEYLSWVEDESEQRKLNAVANLMDRAYRAMEMERRRIEAFSGR